MSVGRSITSIQAPGMIRSFYFGDAAQSDASSDLLGRGVDGAFTWLHFSLSNRQCQGWIDQHVGLPPGALEFLAGLDDHPVLRDFGGVTCGSVPDFSVEFDSEEDDSARLSFAVRPGLLLTGRHRPAKSAQVLVERMEAGLDVASPEKLLEEMLLYFPERVESIAERLGDELETIEDRVMASRPIDERGRIAPVRQLAARHHRLVKAYRRAISRFGHGHGREDRQHLFPAAVLAERLDHIEIELADIEARARLLNEEMVSKLAEETNRILFILSTLTAIFLPPTFVVGFFGMNFSWMPLVQAEGGVWAGLGICVVSSAAVWIFLQWIRRR